MFIALLVLPMVISPIVAGATWWLMFDNRFGPINQILGWIAGEPVTILWTVNPDLVYPAILVCRGLAVDAVHVPDAAGRASPTSTSRSSRRRRSTAPATGAPSASIVLPAIWPVMAVAMLIRGLDLVRLFDIVWALTQRRPRHHDRDHLDLHLRQGLPAVRDQLHRRGRAC